MSEKLDVIVFGATGFTGKEVVKFLHKLVKTKGEKIRWGIGGRNEEKLQLVLEEIGEDSESVPYFIASVNKPVQLIEMTSKCKVLLNCVGPYQLYGEPVVKACLQTATNYIDVTAEPQFMEKTELLHQDEAKEKNIFIVTACGVDSILGEMGLEYLRTQFKGTLNSVETYYQICLPSGPVTGLVNYGTFESLVYVMHNYNQLRRIRTDLWRNRQLPKLRPKLFIRRLPHKKPFFNGWAAPYPSSDAPVMRRAQRYFYENFAERPIQVHTYLIVSQFWQLILLLIFGLFVLFFTSFKFGVELLLKYYKVFTLGIFSKTPNKKLKENLKFEVTLHGKGWEKKVDVACTAPTTSEMVVRVSGCDAYEATAVCALASCVTLLEGIKTRGGVHTSATAFRNTNLIPRLEDYGLNFEILCKNGK